MEELDPVELILLTEEALNLANAACHFDKLENYVGAYDYYDKCILNIDEVMSKLPRSSEQWAKLMELRMQYDDRMEQLKDIEATRNNLSGFSLGFNKSNDNSKSSGKFSKRKLTIQEEFSFVEIDTNKFEFDEPPQSPLEIPFWILKNIKNTIDTGGFITKALFIPKKIWSQSDVKFSGLATKMEAFEIINKSITNNVESLYLADDIDSLNLAEGSFSVLQDELLSLQNQLHKPFPYIKEVIDQSDKDENPASESVVTNSNNTSTKQSNSNKTLAQYMSALSKNVRKYAEVGLHRLAVALPSKLSTEELYDYTTLIKQLCNKCSIISDWNKFVINLKNDKLDNNEVIGNHDNIHLISSHHAHLSSKIENILQILSAIAIAIKDIVCEILLRDIEYLLDRYLQRTRKAFSRMYWDQDVSSTSDN